MFLIVIRVDIAGAACNFVSGASTGRIAFNNIDPSTTPGPVLGTVTQQINFKCGNNQAFTVTAVPASGWTIISGANSIPYSLGFTASGIGTGTGGGQPAIPLLTNTTSITQANYQNAVAGVYANTQAITFTIRWTSGGGGTITASIPVGNVTGTVINTCTVTQSAGTLTFNIDPSLVGTTSGAIAQDLRIKCTKNSSVAISALSKCGGGAPALDTAYPTCGGSKIPYTFNILTGTSGNGFGTGNDISLGIGGSASSVNYMNAPFGNYGDLETITVSY
jgi:hypothetical protein